MEPNNNRINSSRQYDEQSVLGLIYCSFGVYMPIDRAAIYDPFSHCLSNPSRQPLTCMVRYENISRIMLGKLNEAE